MNRGRIVTWTVLAALLGSGWFAVESLLALQLRDRERERVVGRLVEARTLIARNPELFAADPRPASDLALKGLIQEAAARQGLQVGFLSETEKESGKGRREKQVSARLVRAPHAKLVPFLADLESRGQGALVKELHFRPTKELSDHYEDVEVLLARLAAAPEKKP
jgi:hypothetical protein